MKKILKYTIVTALAACMGCSDWLDVNPRTEMKQDVLFQTEEGYKSALIGAYIQLADKNLYGKNTSMYFTELLIQTWTPSTDGVKFPAETYIPKWDFKHANVEPVIETIWKSYYRCIVHLNDILQHIDGAKSLFSNNNYLLIKGEALGLRAFLHLELLRLFGPIPDASAGSKPAIPYAEEMTKDPNKLRTLTFDEVCRKIVRDLDLAEGCLKDDPLTKADNAHLNKPGGYWPEPWEEPNDEWQFYRQIRFNYYAVKGAKARFYHWIGDQENALKYAKEVIDSGKFRLTNENDYKDGTASHDYGPNLVMQSEQLFGVDNPDHQGIIQDLFKSNTPLLAQTDKNIQTAYENITGDIRNVKNRYWIQHVYLSSTYNHFLKYSGNDNISASNQIPLLRLAEMYLIMIEDSPIGAADAYWGEFIIARNLPEAWKGTLTSATVVRERMEKEWRKEFMGEGQMFFFYKKYAYTAYTWPKKITVPSPSYEIPRPQSQIAFD